jgi:hypothetical protein
MRGFTNIFGDRDDSSPPTLWQEGLPYHLWPVQQLKSLCQYIWHQHLLQLAFIAESSRGYINSFGTEDYFTFLDHFGSRGSSTTFEDLHANNVPEMKIYATRRSKRQRYAR